MIDICQWRASIGLWYGHQMPYTIKNTNSNNGVEWKERLLKKLKQKAKKQADQQTAVALVSPLSHMTVTCSSISFTATL